MAHSGYKKLHSAPTDAQLFVKNKPQHSAQILFTLTLFLQLSEPKTANKGKEKKYQNIEINARTRFKMLGAKWKACCLEGRNHKT